MILQSYQDNVLFIAERRFEDEMEVKGLGKLKLDTTYKPAEHARLYGEVVSTPVRLSRTFPIGQRYTGYPAPSLDSSFDPEIKFNSDIAMEVKVGDRIYFNFQILNNPESLVGYFPIGNEIKPVYKVAYQHIYCAVRNKHIIPIGEWCLFEPDMESMDDILVPTYTNLKDQDGNYIPKPKDQWIQAKVAPTGKYLQAYLRHIGTPLRGWEKSKAQPGDLVILRRINQMGSEYPTRLIEGTEYWVGKQRMMDAVLKEEKE